MLKNVYGIAIENDDGRRKQNFSISPTSGVTVYQTLLFFEFFCFSLAVDQLCFHQSSMGPSNTYTRGPITTETFEFKTHKKNKHENAMLKTKK